MRSLTFPRLIGDRSLFSLLLLGDLSLSAGLLGLRSLFFVAPALFLLSRRASLLGQDGFFTVDILLCFGENLGHASLRVL